MSGRKPPPSDVDPEDTAEYVDDDYDDDEVDEEDFVPGAEEEEEDDDEEEVVPLFDGILSWDSEKILHYRGEGFDLTSVTALDQNLLDASTAIKSPLSVEMEGPADIELGSGKPTHRKMEMNWSICSSSETLNSRGKSDPNITSSDAKDSKRPSLSYQVYGKQVDGSRGDFIELRGTYVPSSGAKDVPFTCQVRIIPKSAGAAPAAAAARVDNDDEEEADDEVDYDELIALHEDAGMSVDDLKRKYHCDGGASNGSPTKKGKSMPQDDDDDDDYAF